MIYLPKRLAPVIGLLIAITAVASLAAAIEPRGALYQWLALVPGKIWRGEIWRLVTWVFVETDPLGLLFAWLALYWYGGDLHEGWGDRRFLRYVGAIVLVAGAGTAIFALVLPTGWAYAHLGGWALGDALVIAWAIQYPDRRVQVAGLFSVGGPTLAYGVLAVTGLFALFYGPSAVMPELLAAGAALLYITGRFDRWWNAARVAGPSPN